MKDLIRNSIRQIIYQNELEFVVTDSLDAGFERLAGFLAPAPEAFQESDVRHIERFGVRWALSPSHYFQWHHYFGFDDPVMSALIEEADGHHTILDIGANIGMYSAAMASRCSGSVIAFEPMPATFDQLRSHLAAVKNVEIYQTAMGSTCGTIQMFDQGTSDSGKASARSGTGTGTEVGLSTVDVFVRDHNLNNVGLIKIDVEGLEPEVLKGAQEVLKRDRPVVFLELSPQWLDAAGRDVIRDIGSLGYVTSEVTSCGESAIGLEEALARKFQTNLVLRVAR